MAADPETVLGGRWAEGRGWLAASIDGALCRPVRRRRDAFVIAIATPGPPVDGLDGRMVARLGSSRFGSRRGVPEIGPANVSAQQAREEC